MPETRREIRATASCVLTAIVGAIGATAPALAAGFDIIADTGDAAPDGNGDFPALFTDYRSPVLNNLGDVVFAARRLTTTTDGGVFTGSAGGPVIQLARTGQAAPDNDGTLSSTLFNVDALSVNDVGEFAFSTSYNNASPSRGSGILLSDGSTLTSIARAGDPVPTTVGTFLNFEGGTLNNAGQVAFGARLAGTPGGSPDNWGVFRGTGGTPVQLAREGQPLPGGGNVGDFNNYPNMNGSGTVVLTNNSTAVFIGNGNDLSVVARAGDPAPDQNGSPLGTFTAFSFRESTAPPVISDNGHVLFEARMAGVASTANFGLYVAHDGSTRQVVREGMVTPSGNGTFSDVFLTYSLNSFGQVGFLQQVDNSNAGVADDQALFFHDGSSLVEVVRQGQAAPGGGVFVELLDYALNGSGVAGQQAHFAFAADLDTNNDTTVDATGLFFYDDGALTELIRTGDPLSGTAVTDLALRGSTGGAGQTSSGLNDFGQIAFRYALTDNTAGIALWTPDLRGDYNGSGQIEQGDLDLVLANWGTTGVPIGWVNDPPEGQIEQAELDKVLANWGFTFPDGATGVAPVPEPGAAVGLLAVLVLNAVRRRAGLMQR